MRKNTELGRNGGPVRRKK